MANGLFAGGIGTVSDPYLIEDAFDLDSIRNESSAHYKLINDIDLNIAPYNTDNGWKGFPLSGGSLDGDKFKIKNLFSTDRVSANTPSFINSLSGTSGIAAKVKNIIFENSYVESKRTGVNISLFVSITMGLFEVENIKFINCHLEGALHTTPKYTGVFAEINGYLASNCFIKRMTFENCKIYLRYDGYRHLCALVGNDSNPTLLIEDIAFNNCDLRYNSNQSMTFRAVPAPSGTVKVKNVLVNSTMKVMNKGSVIALDSAFTNSYYNSDLIPSVDVRGLTTKQIQDRDSFVGWDFINTWHISSSGHPDLMSLRSSINKYLFKLGEEIFKYDEAAWNVVGTTPVTKTMFDANGMSDISIIPEKEWKPTMKILCWSDSEETKTANITIPISLYDNTTKAYKGIGIVESDVETLDESRSTLIVTADHKEAVFHYSLDDGANWKVFNLEEMISIKNEEGNLLKIKVELPTTTATLSALSYAWA